MLLTLITMYLLFGGFPFSVKQFNQITVSQCIYRVLQHGSILVCPLPSRCTLAASCAIVSLKTGEQALQMDSPGATGPSWPMRYRLFPRLCCGRRLDVSSLMRCRRCLSPCWERCLCGSVRAAARVWKRRRDGALRSNQIR